MCGIAGILLRPGHDDPESELAVGRMLTSLAHRGPDGTGCETLPGAVLGHRRLSIIDLSNSAAQPMTESSGRYWLTYNGEIYNYVELRTELAEAGFRFRTESDTEVLLAALIHWGEDALNRLIGMYALCFYDAKARTALLARDPFGQKPLFFWERADGALVFASEVKALMAAGYAPRPDMVAWARYFIHARYDDDGDSFFEGVAQLRPGDLVRVTPDRSCRRSRWYDLSKRLAERDSQPAIPILGEAVSELRALLVDTAKLHMRADVPVGVALSGGLDSSALLACIDEAGALDPNVACLSVDFGDDLSEAPWIEAAAAHHGLSSTILGFERTDFAASLAPMMWHLEGPLGGLMNCALAPGYQAARARGMIVVQDGTGLDEAFGGYKVHHDLFVGLAERSGDPSIETVLADHAANWSCSVADSRAAGRRAVKQEVAAIDGSSPVHPELLAPAFVDAHKAPLPRLPSTDDPVRDALTGYLQLEKIPRNMRMKDRASMAFGTELRLPFLDHRLVEAALALPTAWLFLHGRSKAILREALTGMMNDGVRLAPKRSIQAPQGPWLRAEPLRGRIEAILESDRFGDLGMFNVSACRAAFERFSAGMFTNSFFVWQWINVDLWQRTFIEGETRPDWPAWTAFDRDINTAHAGIQRAG